MSNYRYACLNLGRTSLITSGNSYSEVAYELNVSDRVVEADGVDRDWSSENR